MCAGADGAGKFPDGSNFAGALQAFEGAAKFVVHQRHFQTERRRLGVNAVAASDARRELMFLRFLRNDDAKFFYVVDEDVGGLRHLHRERSIDDVAAGEAEVKPAAR